MHFQIFIPNVPNDGKSARDILASVGLGDLADGVFSVQGKPEHSPTHSGGMVFGWVPSHVGLRPSGITWVPSIATDDHEAGAYYVGFWDNDPPKPEELQRRRTHRGESVELANGTRWAFPCVHTFPKDVVIDQYGEATYVTKARFEPLSQAAAYWLSKVESRVANNGELTRFLIDLLKLNYRFTPEVANHLRLFDTDTLVRPLSVFLGIELVAGGAD